MDIDIPLANSTTSEPMFTPGGKRKRADVQADEEDDSLGGMDMNGQSSGMMNMLGRGNGTGVMMSNTMDEGSAAKQLRTTYTPSNPDPNYNPSADSSTAFPFPFPRLTPTLTAGGGSVPVIPGLMGMMTPSSGHGRGSNPGQMQVQQAQGFVVGQGAAGMTGMAGDVFGSGSAGGAGSGSYTTMNGQDYFSRNSINPQQSSSSSSTLAPAPNALRATSPINIQPFSVDLFPPARPVGLMQPTTSSSNIHQQATQGSNAGSASGSRMGSVAGTPMGDEAGMMMRGQGDVDMSGSASVGVEGMDKMDLAAEIEKARNVHGPQCMTIPKLRLSDHPDPVTGQRSMWAMCSSCGSVEMVP